MKTKVLLVLLMSLIGLFFLIAVPSTSSASACGYYYLWYSSCEDTECDPNDIYFVWGLEEYECKCMEDGAWETCDTKDDPDGTICTVTFKLIDGCDDLEEESFSYVDVCYSP